MKPTEQRLFFALWPDPPLRAALAELAGEVFAGRGRLTHPEDIHATLVFLGQVRAEQLPCVAQAAGAIRCSAIRFAIDRVGYWHRPRVLWCAPSRVPETLSVLVADLQQGLQACGFTPEKRPYAPHVTLLRKSPPVGEFALPHPVAWTARDFVLVSSRAGSAPPRYRVLNRWPLDP